MNRSYKQTTILIIALCLILLPIALSQESKQTEPTAITQAENAVANAKQVAQNTYINALNTDLSDCGKVVAAVANLKLSAQSLQFAEERLANIKKAK